jgi:hypothetical protein
VTLPAIALGDPKGAALLRLLYQTRFAEYTVSHDRVFALLGLLNSKLAALINVDYNQPIVEVYQNVCSAHLQSRGDVEFLSHCDWSTHRHNPGHPSWTPDWSTWRPMKLLGWQQASGYSQTRKDGLNGSRLTVDGVFCGIVDKVGDEMPLQGDMRVTLRRWERLVEDNESGWREQLIETLSCGETYEDWPGTSFPSLEEYRKAYYDQENEPIISIFTYGNGGMGIGSPGAKEGM